MHIKIAERLRPFCHLPGSSCILPGSPYEVQIFPTRLRIFDLSLAGSELLLEMTFDIQGPLKDFTIQNDLERGEIRVWGETSKGFLRYRLNSCQSAKNILLHIEKAPGDLLRVYSGCDELFLKPKEVHSLLNGGKGTDEEIYRPSEIEQLSFGNHKSQDWELIHRRHDLTEIFPVWHRLGQLIIPKPQPDPCDISLLRECREAVSHHKPEHLVALWTRLYLSYFKSILVPGQYKNYLGIVTDNELNSISSSSLVLLSEGSRLIRELFLQGADLCIKLLPSLPPEFHCGRLLGVKIPGGIFSLEWTKKIIRRCEFKVDAEKDVSLQLDFRHVKQCRLRTGGKDKGRIVTSGQQVDFEKNHHYFFDNFT